MRRLIVMVVMLFVLLALNGCNKNKTDDQNAQLTISPTLQPVVTQPDEDTSGTQPDQETGTRALADYFLIQADSQYVYEGKGNEYASYTVYTDFVDTANNKVQTRTDNGGSQTVRVIELKDGKVSVIYTANECYYRDSFMDKTASAESEVLLMEPLEEGTQWTLPDGKKRYISAVDVSVDVPFGQCKALEVTTEGTDYVTKDYYAPQVGLIKSVYTSSEANADEVSSSLKELNTNIPYTQTIDVYYPDTDEKIYVEPLTLSLRTNEVTSEVLVEALRQEAVKESYLPLVSENTVINRMYLGEDGIVYVDFSQDLIKDMNLGSGYEALVLQSITNTLGNYYGVKEVCITVAGKPYESGHILMKEGETFSVNMEKVSQ